jgi:hypothetical protein
MDRRNSAAHGQGLIQQINAHSARVRKREITCTSTVCCHCSMHVGGSHAPFAFHGTRPRRFLVLVGLYVCRVPALLARWRCPHCHTTFTDYPSFACPHKAYTLPQMTERAAAYVNNTATSYRKGVCSGNLPIFYAQGPANKSVQHHHSDAILSCITMAHSSLFHWVTALSRDALRQPEPPDTDFAPAPRKYASERRRSILIACRATCSHLLLGPPPIAQPCG